MTDSVDLGIRLQRQREMRGVSLQAVSDETKIHLGLLSDLERGDLSQWPPGLYGRAFIRSYAEAVGLEPREVLAEFLRLVPADEGVIQPSHAEHETPRLPGWTFHPHQAEAVPSNLDGATLRLTLADGESGEPRRAARWWRSLLAFTADGAILLAGSAIGLLALGPDGWLTGLAVTSVVLVALASAVLGTTPGRRLVGPQTGPWPRVFDRGKASLGHTPSTGPTLRRRRR